MSDETMVTERAAVLREREAYAQRARDDYNDSGWVHNEEHVRARAAARYPLPKVVRPRVVPDAVHPDYEWKAELDMLWFRWRTASAPKWMRAGSNTENLLLVPTPERVALWADLYARPAEEVEE